MLAVVLALAAAGQAAELHFVPADAEDTVVDGRPRPLDVFVAEGAPDLYLVAVGAVAIIDCHRGEVLLGARATPDRGISYAADLSAARVAKGSEVVVRTRGGRRIVEASWSPHSARFSVAIPPPEAEEAEVVLEAVPLSEPSRARVEGLASDGGGRPVAGVKIEAAARNGSSRSAVTDDAGRYTIDDLPFTASGRDGLGEAGFRVEPAPGWQCEPGTGSLALQAGLTTRQDVTCSQLTVAGRHRVIVRIRRGDLATVEAALTGEIDLQSSTGGSLSGSGRGRFALTAAGGACHGAVPVTMNATGRLDGGVVRLDVTYGSGGVLAWKCSGAELPVPVGIAALEDEGRGLELRVTSRQPLRALLDRSTGGPAAGAVHWHVEITP